MQGLKRKRRCENQCFDHLFSLKNLKSNPKYDIKLNFCPKYQRQPLPPQHTFAQYNNDSLFYTSAFVLGVDKKLIAKNLQKEMLDHQKLIKENCEKYNQIVFPRPNSKHTTCSVCKQQYKNYYSHIFSDEHSQKIQASNYNFHIKQLCQLFMDQWVGCAQKADQQALNYEQNGKKQDEKKNSEQWDLDDILQQEEINQNLSPIEKQIEQQSPRKQVVIKRPTRNYEYIQPQKPKVQLDRQSRKKKLNFSVFFQQQPKKKVINQHREAITVSSKKLTKMPSISQTKSKQTINKKVSEKTIQLNDPFIIEYNARAKRKQKKSYYYIKKKQRLERQMRERQLNQGQQKGQNFQQNQIEGSQMQQYDQQYNQNSNDNQNQNSEQQHSQRSQEEYQKYLEDFHKEEKKYFTREPQIKKTFSKENLWFQEVQKKTFINPVLDSVSNPFNEKSPASQKSTHSKKTPPQMLYQTYTNKKPIQNLIPNISNNQRKNLLFQQKQQISDKNKNNQIADKNKINFSHQNQLPIFHKFKNPLQKQYNKQIEVKPQKASQQVFNQYQEKLREYKQRNQNQKYKISQKNHYQQKKNIFQFDQSTVKINGNNFLQKQIQQSAKYQERKQEYVEDKQYLPIQNKPQVYPKYKSYSQGIYHNKTISQKQVIHNPVPISNALSSVPPTVPFYPNHNQFFNHSYGYPPISSYGYPPVHDPQKDTRPPIKYTDPRQRQTYERSMYYGAGWQPSYYMPSPTGTVIPPTILPNQHDSAKNFPLNPYNGAKNQKKPDLYSNYLNYPTYPGYPGYYGNPATHYPMAQRPDYPHPPTNMRIPPPNTSININFPMYVGPPYGGYQYSSQTGQRYPPSSQPNVNAPPGHYPVQSPQSSHPGANYNQNANSSLPPYAQYQEYKKRQSQRRR